MRECVHSYDIAGDGCSLVVSEQNYKAGKPGPRPGVAVKTDRDIFGLNNKNTKVALEMCVQSGDQANRKDYLPATPLEAGYNPSVFRVALILA